MTTLPAGDVAFSTQEITVGQFRVFANKSGYKTASGCITFNQGAEEGTWALRNEANWSSPGFPQQEDHPVVCINLHDARAYALWIRQTSGKHYRLPTEAEWNLAARAGTTTKYYWGETEAAQCNHANAADLTPFPDGRQWRNRAQCRDGYAYTAPVGHYVANAFGIYDLFGNVWEWVESCSTEADGASTVRNAYRTAAPDCTRGILRGGSWSYFPDGLRSSSRAQVVAEHRYAGSGMRLARTL